MSAEEKKIDTPSAQAIDADAHQASTEAKVTVDDKSADVAGRFLAG